MYLYGNTEYLTDTGILKTDFCPISVTQHKHNKGNTLYLWMETFIAYRDINYKSVTFNILSKSEILK